MKDFIYNKMKKRFELIVSCSGAKKIIFPYLRKDKQKCFKLNFFYKSKKKEKKQKQKK